MGSVCVPSPWRISKRTVLRNVNTSGLVINAISVLCFLENVYMAQRIEISLNVKLKIYPVVISRNPQLIIKLTLFSLVDLLMELFLY